MLRQRLIAPRWLISLGAVQDLDAISVDDGALTVGALVTHREMERNPIVREKWPVLAEAFASVANVRIRNAATVGGVLAEADYASDPPAVFVALDATVEVLGPGGPAPSRLPSSSRASTRRCWRRTRSSPASPSRSCLPVRAPPTRS